jgi:hypothetical protein
MGNKSKKASSLFIIVIVLVSIFIPILNARDYQDVNGFDKGPSYTSVVPVKKVTFVNFDENSYLDDYAYLASVPTSVFRDQQENRLFSHPLLFYQDKLKLDNETHKTLDAFEGIHYFMEDWMSYCNGQLDQKMLINIPESKVKQWNSKEVITIDCQNPYDIANYIALHDWSYSNSAVVAVIGEDFEKPKNEFSGNVEGKLQKGNIKEEYFQVPQTNKLNPQYKTFNVPEGYKYIQAKTWFACLEKMIVPFMWIVLPAGDKDMQLYCRYNNDWMQVAACSTNTNQWGMDPEAERANSYIYSSGEWMVGITDIPTKSTSQPNHVIKERRLFTRHGTWLEIISNLIRGVNYNIEVMMYPGVEVEIPKTPPFECNNVEFKLTWNDPNIKLGFSLIGPGGEEIISNLNEEEKNQKIIRLDELGQCIEGEKYKVCVFAMDTVHRDIDFKVEYSWSLRITEEEGNALASATEGAVLASCLNTPLLYISKSKLSKGTSDVLYKLGVKNIYLVDFGNHLSKEIKDKINDIALIKKHYTKIENIFSDIMELTGQNDIIWTTIDPWTYWFFDDKPAGEKEKALFIGPAAYCAAHHGSPVIIVDMHPHLSSAVVWHNEFWKNTADERTEYHPSVSEMYLTGIRAYDFLKENGFNDAPLDMESMITIADHFDIGMSWDRAFAGKAKPGRILGTPVDTTVWISRNIFYPALIYVNPALSASGVELINGSISRRRNILPWGKGGLKIERESGPERYKFPILHTYTCYMHRFNEMSEKYYGFTYTTADGYEPGRTISFNPIDDGVKLKYTGEAGSFFPDLTPSEIIPLYASRGGYSNAFSTSFEATMNNLNQGVILWFRSGHGTNSRGGGTTFWNPKGGLFAGGVPKLAGAIKEENPWRGYEWYLGSTEDPDTMTMDVHGIIPALLGNPNLNGIFRTGLDWAPAKKPVLDKIGNLLNIIPVIKNMRIFQWIIDNDDYRDGMVQSIVLSTFGYPKYYALEYDEAMDNIYSCGILMGDCQPAGTFLHLSLVRHGSPFQIIDPWPTSWYATTWEQLIPRDLALGYTIGEAYVNGISKVGILYIGGGKDGGPQWWWDLMQNVCFYGDPNLRVLVPGTDYSNANYWRKKMYNR